MEAFVARNNGGAGTTDAIHPVRLNHLKRRTTRLKGWMAD